VVTKQATLEWIPKELGGRSNLPSGDTEPPYATVVQFPSLGEPWSAPVAWTLVVRKVSVLDEPHNWIADVRFLFEDAPQHILVGGTEFELYEGKKRVACGRIIG
jgi:hypothetical protein